MAINSVTPTYTSAATAHTTTTQAARKPAKAFPSMSELMSAGQSAAQNAQTTTGTASSTSTSTAAGQANKI